MKTNSILWGCRALFLSLLMACSETPSAEGEEPKPSPSDPLTFAVEIYDVTLDEVDYRVEPSDRETTYRLLIAETATWEVAGSDAAFIEADLKALRTEAEQIPQGWEAYLAEQLLTGVARAKQGGLIPDTDYLLCLYGLNAKGEVTTSLTREPFRTDPEPTLNEEYTFDIRVSQIAYTTADVAISVEPADTRYFVNYLTPEACAEAESLQEAFCQHWAFFVDVYRSMGYTDEELLAWLTFVGEMEDDFADLLPGTDYYAYALPVDERLAVVGSAAYILFTTRAAEPSDMTFTCRIDAYGEETVQGEITPSREDMPYFLTIEPVAFRELYTSDLAYMCALAEGLGESALRYGSADLSQFTGLTPGEEYWILCFGYREAPNTPLFAFPLVCPN